MGSKQQQQKKAAQKYPAWQVSKARYHKIIEWLGSEGIFKDHVDQFPKYAYELK